MQYRPIYITHVPSLSSLPSYMQLQGSMVGSSDDQATSKDHLHPSPPSHKMLIYSFNLLTISLPLLLPVNSNCNLSIITHPIVTSHFQISNNFASEPYLSRCYLNSPHCHLSLLVLILNNLILQIIPKEK